MGLSDRLKDLTKKAEDTAADHKDQIHEAVQRAEAMADQRTAGQYHDKIVKAADMADAYLDKLNPPVEPVADQATTPPKAP
jgi:ElaB/YqjD/DUF883 family membrane-anchored ribosome-binding protein